MNSDDLNGAGTAAPDVVTMEKIVALCKRRGFIFQSSEIYGGLASTYDYGHYGVLLKNNVKAEWWRAMLQERDDIVALDEHRLPPLGLDVGLQQDAVVAVVVRRAESAVDLRRREHEAAPLAQRDDLLHGHHVLRLARHRAETLESPSATLFLARVRSRKIPANTTFLGERIDRGLL